MEEKITSLSFVLESLSRRLDELAVQIEEQEKRGIKLESNARAVQEVVLKAVASMDSDLEININDLIEHLKMKTP